MNPSWESTIEEVTEAMRNHVRPFVTPLSMDRPMSNKVTLEGTGSYVLLGGNRVVITCEHVAKRGDLNLGFYGSPDVFGYRGPWFMDPPPVDLALAPVTDAVWAKTPHQAATIPYERFAERHAISERAELLFFLGFAGENSAYGFGHFESPGSAYLSQEKTETGNAKYFEMFWKPKDIQYTADTTPEEQARVKHGDARGLSGTLVWNTRFVEVSSAGRDWSPNDAVVTGMVQRWDDVTETLLVHRVEHIRTWIST